MSGTTGIKRLRPLRWMPLLFLFLLAASPFILRSILLSRGAAEKVKAEVIRAVESSLGSPLRVGELTLDLFGRVVIKDVKLGEGADAIFEADRLVAGINLLTLLDRKKNPGEVVSYVRVERPVVRVIRFADGTWNYAPLFRNTSGAADAGLPEFPVTIRKGSAVFDDRYAAAPYPVTHYEVGGMKGRLDLRREKVLLLTLAAEKGSLGDHIRAKLRYDMRAGWRVEGSINNLPLDLLPKLAGQKNLSADGNLDSMSFFVESAFTKIGNPPNFSWGITTKISGASLTLNDYGITLTDAAANLAIVNGAVSLESGSAKLGSGSVSFSGIIHSWGGGGLVFYAGLDGVDLDILAPVLDIKSAGGLPSGTVSGSIMVSGSYKSPDAAITLDAENLRYDGFQADSATVRAVFADHRLSIERADLRRGGGRAVISGTVDFSEDNKLLEYGLTADINGIDIPELLRSAGSEAEKNIDGTMYGKVYLRGDGKGGFSLFGTVESGELELSGMEPGAALGSFTYEKGMLTIENLVIEGAEETLVARGTVGGKGELDIQVDGARSRVSELLALFGRGDLESAGTVSFRGRIGGTVSEPSFEGAMEGRAVAVSTFHADRITGAVSYSGSVLNLGEVSIYTGLDRHEVAGKINFEDRSLIVYVIMQDTSLKDLTILARDMFRTQFQMPEDLGGVINARGLIMGTFDNPIVSMRIAASEITLYGEKIDSLEAMVDYIEYPIVNKGVVKFAGASIAISGVLDPENMNVEFRGDGLALEKISHMADLHASGTVGVSGLITGAFDSPVLHARIVPGKFSYMNLDFTAAAADVIYDSGELTSRNISLSRGDERYEISLKYDFAASSSDVRVGLRNAALKTLTGFLPYRIPEGTSGVLNGECRVFISLGEYSGILNLSGNDLSFGSYPIDELAMEGNFEGRTLYITKFESRNDVSEVKLSGTFDLDQKIASNMNVSAYGIELSRFSDMGLIPFPAGGLADLDIEMIGENGTQKMVGSITALNPSLYELAFDRARGRFESDGNVISISEIQFLSGSKRLTLAADIPIKKGFEDRFSVRPGSPDFDLSILNPVLAHYGIGIEGEMLLDNVGITGSVKDPKFSGALTLSNAVFRHSDLGVPVSAINGKMHFENDRLVVESLSGRINDKEVNIKGGLKFRGFLPDTFDFTLADAGGVYVEYKDIYKGKVDVQNFAVRKTSAGIEIYSPTEQAPAVTLHDASVYPPQVAPESEPRKPATPISFGPRNITVNVTDGVVIKSGRNALRMETTGRLQVAGTSLKPEVRGWLTSERGHLRYLGNTFKMVENTIIGFYSLEGVGIVPIFYMMAKTRVSGTDVTMRISGPMVDVNLYPSYKELCSGTETLGTGTGLNVPHMDMGEGGEISVPVCPEADFLAYEDNMTGGPLLSTQQIMQKLTHTDRLMDNPDEETADVLRAEAFSMFTPYVGAVVEKGINLENFTINLDPNKDVLVQLEKRVAEKLYIRYERLFSRSIEQTIEARYKFRKRSFLKWGIDQDNVSDFQVEYQLRF